MPTDNNLTVKENFPQGGSVRTGLSLTSSLNYLMTLLRMQTTNYTMDYYLQRCTP